MDDLIIPLKLDSRQALADLQRLSAEGKRSGKDVEEGLEGASKSAKGLGSAMGEIISHQGYQMLRDAAAAIGKGFQETAEYVKSISKEFTQLQEALRIIATFKGEKLTDQFTVDTAMKGAAAGLTPQQFKDFEKQFTGFAGQFVGEGKKFSAAQGEDLEKRAASFMNVRGIDPSQGGAIFGEILQQATGKESTDELMEKFGKAYVVLEQAKGDPGQLLGQIGQVTAQGVDVQTASKLMRATAQRDPGDAGTMARAVLRGLSSIRTEGKEGELGITGDMDVFQQLEAINKKAPTEQKAREDFIRKYFKDEREFSGVMAGINFGVKGGLFTAADKEAAGITGRTDIEAVDEFKESGPGRRIFGQAQVEAERIKRGAEYGDVTSLKIEAEKELTRTGRYEEMGFNDIVRAISPFAPSIKDQLTNEKAIELAEQQSGLETKFLSTQGLAQTEVDKEIKRLLTEGNQDRKASLQKPLSAPPPTTGERP